MLKRRLVINGEEFCLAAGQCGQGAPTKDTDGCEGATYMDTDTKEMYKCTKCDNGKYEWEPLAPTDVVLYTKQELSEEQKAQARENIGALPGGEDGTIGGKRIIDWVYPPGFYCICDSKNLPVDHFGGRWECAEVSGDKYYWKRLPDYDAYILFVGESGDLYIEGEGVMPGFYLDESTGDLYTDSTQNFEYNQETGELFVIDL